MSFDASGIALLLLILLSLPAAWAQDGRLRVVVLDQTSATTNPLIGHGPD